MNHKSAPPQCPNCSEVPQDENVRLLQCPECRAEGYDECCFPAGAGTLCLDCEFAEADANEEY